MNRIDRLFGMLTFLQSRKFSPADKIADKFGISVRTVYRDIRALNEQGVPVGFEPSKGYFVTRGFFLPPVAFTQDEANALLLMERIAFAFADQSIGKYYTAAMDKVRAAMPASQQDRLEQLNYHIRVRIPPCFRYDQEYLSILQDALSARLAVEIDYKNKREEVSKRLVEPIGLVFYAMGWHLIGWCRMRRDYRDFKVPRILGLRRTSRPFEVANHMKLEEYMLLLPDTEVAQKEFQTGLP